jgi:hypothetical protein
MKSYIYFNHSQFVIADIENCAQSERTFDVQFFDLANNEKVLNLLNLYYMQGNYGVKYTHESRAQWFAGYISAFNTKQQTEMREKLITNPTVRLLVLDDKLLRQIQTLLVQTNLWDKVWEDAKKEDDFDDR